MVYQIKNGLDLPIEGKPVQDIGGSADIKSVGIIADDYVGMRPTMLVAVGDRVKLGQPVFTDKKTPGVIFTAPGCGTVKAINRGAKRKFESVEIDLDGDEQEIFDSFQDLQSIPKETIQKQLVDSGMWAVVSNTAFQPDSCPGKRSSFHFCHRDRHESSVGRTRISDL